MSSVISIWSREAVLGDCVLWPDEAERKQWISLFGDDVPCKRWSRYTAYNCASVYTRYFLLTGEEEVTPDGLKLFISLCEAGAVRAPCCPRTIAGYVAAIYRILRLLHPDNRFELLKVIVFQMLRLASQTPKRRSAAVKDAREVVALGWKLIALGREAEETDTRRARVLFRTGLFLLLGIYIPERLRAWSSLTISQIDFTAGTILFEGKQTKNGRDNARPIPPELIPPMREWLDDFRGEPAHDFFWIAVTSGGAAVPATLYAALRKETRELGTPVTPHPLRNAAATFIVRQAPEKAAIASIVLGQRDPTMVKEYTEGAEMMEAARQATAIIKNAGTLPKTRRGARARNRKFKPHWRLSG